MKLRENQSLKLLNTFGMNVRCRYFAGLSDIHQLQTLLEQDAFRNIRKLVLGGGSNILFTKDFDGLLIKNNLSGIRLVREDKDHFYVQASAGENWHNFVLHCIQKGFAGVENLSLIPGCVGAAPIQNIGAYGVELKDVFHELEAWDMEKMQPHVFKMDDCRFGYRDSIFKKEAKGRYIITSVTFRLNKKPVLHTAYGALQQELDRMKITEPGIEAVSRAVISIRTAKLPDPARIGNAGSFFKNPVVSNENFKQLKLQFPLIVNYPDKQGVKLAAGWLIEQCGWKGFREGDAGVHGDQALVLVNYGNASGKELFMLSGRIMESVEKKFGVKLEREVNIL